MGRIQSPGCISSRDYAVAKLKLRLVLSLGPLDVYGIDKPRNIKTLQENPTI